MAAHDFTADDLEAAGALGGTRDPGYIWPQDPRTQAALEHWQDLKVGVIIHWGLYSAIGQGGSWSLHRERLGEFTDPPEHFTGTDAEYHDWYYDQRRSFHGAEYDPVEWARACSDAGMRYLVFTTKHHDGFAMYDTAYSNLKSTAEDAALGRDVFGETVEAFRAEGLETGAYFSKADWAHPGYWDRARPVKDRFHNYDIAQRPEAWRQFVDFTHAQIEELLTRYGTMNVLWLDAGWVREPNEPIGIDRIAERARELQPDILVVDREVHGPHENYRTPEQTLPAEDPGHPWESCITMTRSWCSLRRDDPAKPIEEILGNLLQIVSRGGNYLIGIGPDAEGRLSASVRERLSELGTWLHACGEGIYGTRGGSADAGEVSGGGLEWHHTRKGQTLYAFALLQDGPLQHAAQAERDRAADAPGGGPVEVRLPAGARAARLLGGEGLPLRTAADGAVTVALTSSPTAHAVGLAVEM